MSETDLYQSWTLNSDTHQFELQDFRNYWINIFIWMRKCKNGEATKIEVGNQQIGFCTCTNLSLLTHWIRLKLIAGVEYFSCCSTHQSASRLGK